MLRMFGLGSLLLLAFPHSTNAANEQPRDTLERAQTLSSLTGPGAQPFHLKLTVSEPGNPHSPYDATIEEFWLSSTNWSRTIGAPEFRQRLSVTRGIRDEQNAGAYYPLWLRSFVTAAIDPLEDAAFWQHISARMVSIKSAQAQARASCARSQFKIGTAAVNNDAFAVICFNADGTLASVLRPGYGMEFQDFRSFEKKLIAYRYVDNPEPSTELVGRIDVLEKIAPPDARPTALSFPEQTSGPIKSVPVSQEVFESLSPTPIALVWPAVTSGLTSGKLSMYVSVDRDGHIREAYPLNADNAGLQEAARDQLLKTQLRPAMVGGQRVQAEAALTSGFSTQLGNTTGSTGAPAASPLASPGKPLVISQGAAAALLRKSYAPVYPQALKERHVAGIVALTAVIGRKGQIVSLTPLSSTDPELTKAAIAAVQQWVYNPYLLNGSPVEVQAVITVNFQVR